MEDIVSVDDPEIELTPEMIEAGKRAFFEWNENDDPSISNLVTAMIRAIEQTRQPIKPGEAQRLFREFARETILNIQSLVEETELRLARAKELFREIDEQGADDLCRNKAPAKPEPEGE